jgi:hypothetical protein
MRGQLLGAIYVLVSIGAACMEVAAGRLVGTWSDDQLISVFGMSAWEQMQKLLHASRTVGCCAIKAHHHSALATHLGCSMYAGKHEFATHLEGSAAAGTARRCG